MFGMHVHTAVLAAGERVTGVTVHLVDSDYDRGPILAQAQVAVEAGDTPERLQARVLKEEHRLFPETLGRIAMGEIVLDAVRLLASGTPAGAGTVGRLAFLQTLGSLG